MEATKPEKKRPKSISTFLISWFPNSSLPEPQGQIRSAKPFARLVRGKESGVAKIFEDEHMLAFMPRGEKAKRESAGLEIAGPSE
ncbi:MAG TPA: hypothetical protein VGI85_05115 [Chthoniobacterales bacterium]